MYELTLKTMLCCSFYTCILFP